MSITHYLPEFLLEQFRDPSLLELDIATSRIETRSLLKAGSKEALWSAEIENEMMGEYDNKAARILRRKVWTRERITLTTHERVDFGYWLALFMTRVPVVHEATRKYLEAADANPEIAVQAMYSQRETALQIIREEDPKVYDQTLASMGREGGEEHLLRLTAGRIRSRQVPYLPDLTDTYSKNLKDQEPHLTAMAKRFARMHWTWHCTQYGFCIGDNPVCRWHVATGEPMWNLPDRRDVEVTFPVSKRVTLCMTNEEHGVERIVRCNTKRTRHFNHRQRISALKHVYAGKAELLNRKARYGFDADLPSVYAERRFDFPLAQNGNLDQ